MARPGQPVLESEAREIVIPHAPGFQAVSAVKHVVLLSGMSQLRTHGYFDRYAKLIAPDALEQLQASLASAWIPVELAHAHYGACEALNLSNEEIARIGQGVGDRLQETSLVTNAKKQNLVEFDSYAVVGPLHRMWARLYQGGSIQVARVGERDTLIEVCGFSLNQYRYHRQSQLSSISASCLAVGVRVKQVKIVRHDQTSHDLTVRMLWS